jgi:hypothetical protein
VTEKRRELEWKWESTKGTKNRKNHGGLEDEMKMERELLRVIARGNGEKGEE